MLEQEENMRLVQVWGFWEESSCCVNYMWLNFHLFLLLL